MGVEIERKFLVTGDAWKGHGAGAPYRQGYLSRGDGPTVRVRNAAGRGLLTIKGATKGFSRPEFEYEIPVADADELLGMCGALVEKDRYRVPHEGHTWEVDVFKGESAGLIVAEIELSRPDEEFARPAWLGQEVSDDHRYSNSNLALRPFSRWGQKAPPA